MKATYESPTFSMSECRVEDTFLTSAVTTPTTSIQFDDTNGWSDMIPPKH